MDADVIVSLLAERRALEAKAGDAHMVVRLMVGNAADREKHFLVIAAVRTESEQRPPRLRRARRDFLQ